MNPTPILSVIIPVYNVEKYLPETIQSVVNQDFEDFEALFVDDGSTDSSPLILKKAQAEHPQKIKILTLSHNRGLVFARKTGVLNAQGQYLTFLDGDDTFLPHALQTMVEEIENKQCEMVRFSFEMEGIEATDTERFKGAQEGVKKVQSFYVQQTPCFSNECIWQTMALSPSHIICAVVFQKALLKKVFSALTDDYIVYSEDDYTHLILCHFAQSLDFSPKPVLCYRQNSGVVSSLEISEKKIQTAFLSVKNIHHALEEFIATHTVHPLFLKGAKALPKLILTNRARALSCARQKHLDEAFGKESDSELKRYGEELLFSIPASRAERLGAVLLSPFIFLGIIPLSRARQFGRFLLFPLIKLRDYLRTFKNPR